MKNKEELLSRLEGLPYIERVKRVIEFGRESKSDPQKAALLTQLWGGDAYERRLALYSCYGSGDGERVLTAVSDPSRLVRSLSLSMVGPICDDRQALLALELAYTRKKHVTILRMLRQRGRFDVVDAFLEKLSQQKDPRFSDYVAFASPKKFSGWMEHALSYPSELFWQRVLMRFPEEVLGYLKKQVETSTDGLTIKNKQLLSMAMPVLLKKLPEQLLPLLEALIVAGAPDWRPRLQELFLKLPAKVFALLRKYKLNLKTYPFSRVIHQLEKSQFLFLLKEHRTLLGDPMGWFSHHPNAERETKTRQWLAENPEVLQLWRDGLPKEPLWGMWLFQFLPDDPETLEERVRLYELWSLASRDAKGAIAHHLFYVLPKSFQEREARRHLTEVKSLETAPVVRLQYCTYLPWQEAQEHLRPWLHHPEVPVRAAILGLYLGLLARQDGFDTEEALGLVKQRKFEADPVRHAMLVALYHWPQRHWSKDNIESMQALIQDALDASDLSYGSLSCLAGLARRFILVDAERAFDWLILLDKQRRGVESPNFGEQKALQPVATFAAPCMRFAQRLVPGREQQLLMLLSSFGEEAQSLPGVDALLSKVDCTKLHAGLQLNLLQYLNHHFPKLMRAALTKSLVGLDAKNKGALLGNLLQSSSSNDLRGALLEEVVSHLLAQKEPTELLRFLLPLYHKNTEYARELLPKISRGLPPNAWQEVARELLEKTSFFQPEEMYPLCVALLQKTESSDLADRLVSFLLNHHKPRFLLELPELLKEDVSIGTLPSLLEDISWSRQHHLTPYLSGAKLNGRFAKPAGWIPPLKPRGLYRCSRAQQARLAATIDGQLADKERDHTSLLSLLPQRANLAYTAQAPLLALAQDARAPIREKSIRLLSRLDAGQGVETLLDCLDDERARFAVYGFRKTILELPPDAAISLLKKTPTTKVTITKELFRLLGELRSEEAYQLLISMYAPSLHRDSRIAHLRALWEHLEREETWELFSRAVKDPDWFVAVKLAETPTSRLTKYSEAKLAENIAALLQRQEPEARISILERAASIHIADKERLLLKACLLRLGSAYLDESKAAARAILHRAQGRDIELVMAGIRMVLPFKRQLLILLEELISMLSNRSKEQHQIAHGVLLLLLQDELLTTQAVRLLIALESPQLLIDVLRQLSSQGRLYPDVMIVLFEGIKRLSLADAELLELGLSGEKDPMLRRLALEALLQATRHSWTRLRIRRINLFQQDPSPLVASVAQFVFPPGATD